MKKNLLITTVIITATLLSTTIFTAPLEVNAKTNQNRLAQDGVATRPGYLTGNDVYVRDGPSEDHRPLGTRSKRYNHIVRVVSGPENGFLKIINPFGSGYAYISNKYVDDLYSVD